MDKVMVKIKKGNLDEVTSVLAEIGDIKLSFSLAARIHNAGIPFRAALKERDELKNALVKPYVSESKSLSPGDEGYTEIIAKINALMAEEIEIELNGPLIVFPEKFEVKTNWLVVLSFYGLTEVNESPKVESV